MTPEYRKMLWGPLRGGGRRFQGGSGLASLQPPGFEKADCYLYIITFRSLGQDGTCQVDSVKDVDFGDVMGVFSLHISFNSQYVAAGCGNGSIQVMADLICHLACDIIMYHDDMCSL